MSQARKGGGKGPPKDKIDDGKDKESKEKVPSKDKEETGSNADSEETIPKPQSAGVASRDAAQRVLALCQKGEWAPVDQVLKSMEKAIANAGDDANTVPLAGVIDLATGMTPLMYAVKDNRTSLLDKMIDLGSDVGARNNVSRNIQEVVIVKYIILFNVPTHSFLKRIA
ncbi:hypothetical protein RI129_006594 [Pyrocoelia pectoralis]|uniref:Uncharacterized protein n=1 Tax=Pyrocoelia pectoralis TaxID=417401 RepID=A0AAN7VFJ6_9COLE